MSEDKIKNVIAVLDELKDDITVPKNIKNKIEEIVKALKEKDEYSIRVNKALNILDEISEDTNMQPYTRSQIWNVVSMLESI